MDGPDGAPPDVAGPQHGHLSGIFALRNFLPATWYYAPNFDRTVPDWVIFLSGYATIAYYTLDCMDGKQARRTGQSSPLGQLFDHGFDCISNLCHISTQAGYLSVGGTWWFFALQGSIFFAFFMAQWEEYYTGELPHAMGNFGVTEVNYFMGFFAIFNSFIDREALWQNPLGDKLPEALSVHVPSAIADMEVRHFGLTLWLTTTVVLIIGSLYRVLLHKNVTDHNLRFSALSKLATPSSPLPHLLSRTTSSKLPPGTCRSAWDFS